jgi:hypothetical protein
VVCQVMHAHVAGEVMDTFEEIPMCHPHLVAARSGMLAAWLLTDARLAFKPAPPLVEQPLPRRTAKVAPTNSRTLQIVERLKRGDGRMVIARDMGVGPHYVSMLQHYHLTPAEVTARKKLLPQSERVEKILALLRAGGRVSDVAITAEVSTSYVSRLKMRLRKESMRREKRDGIRKDSQDGREH